MSDSYPHRFPQRVVVRAGEPCPQPLRADDPETLRALSWPRGLHSWIGALSPHCIWCGQHVDVPRVGWTVYDPSSDSIGYYADHAQALDAANELWCRAVRQNPMARADYTVATGLRVLRRIGAFG